MASHAGRRNEGPADPSYEREPRRYPPSHQAFQRQQQQQQQPPQHYPNRPLPHPSEEVPFQDGLSQPRQNGPPQHNHLHRRRPDGPLLQSHDGNYNQTSNTSSRRRRRWSDMTRTIAHYERIEQIGEGTYGQVYMAKCKDTNEIVAMKKIRVHHGAHWGMPPTVIREIKILKTLVHPNLVKMHEVVSSKGVEHLDADDYHKGSDRSRKKHKLKTAASDGKLDASDSNKNETRSSNNHSSTVEKSNDNTNNNNSKYATDVADARESYKGNLFLVLEYVPHDLTGLLDVAYKFREVEIKCIFKQLLQALQYMHEQKYVHRDIKSSNILIDRHFRLKLADFGLARSIEPPLLDKLHDRGNSQDFTNKVITLWYRPPELLLGATKYGAAVDIWSAGCILAELVLGKPLFTGKTEMDQLQLIFDMVGTPTPKSWPGIQDLKLLRTGDVSIDASSSSSKRPKFRERYYSKMNAIAPGAMQLVEKLLELDPSKRLTASRALNHRYFMAEPQAPELPEMLGEMKLAEGGSFHEFQTKKKRKEAKAQAEKVKQAALDGGHTAKEAQEEYDAVYRGIMEKVAMEGLNTEKPAEEPEIPSKSERSNSKHRERSSTNGSKHKSRESSRSQKDRRSSTRERSHRDGSEKTRERKSRDDKTTDRERLRSSDRRSSETETKRRSRESSVDRDKTLPGGAETAEATSSALEGSGKAPEQAPPPAKEPQKDIPAKDASGPPDTGDPSSKTDTERRKKDDTNPTKDETKDQQRSHRSSEKKRSKDRSREGEKRHHRDRDHRKRSSRDGHDEDRDRSSRKSASSSKRRKHHRDRSRSRSPPSDYRSGRGMEDHPRDRPRGDRRSYMDDPHDDRRIFPPRDGHPMSRGFPSPPRGGPPRGPPRGGEYPPYGRGPPYDDRGPRGGFYDRPPPEGYPRGPSRPPPRDYYDGIPPGHRDREGRRDRDRRDRR